MTDTVNFSDETRDRSVVRKAEYDDADPKDLVLTIPSRNGGQIKVPLLKQARSNIEREDYQENTLLRIKPLAEIESNLPVKSGGITVYQGKGVALLRPGYLYVFRNDRLWRELEIGEDSRFSDIDLEAIRPDLEDPDSDLRIARPASGEWLDDVLVPVFLQGQAVMHDFRMAYSEIQWDWSYIDHLERNEPARNVRTTGVGPAWATSSVEGLSFESGFVASRVEDVSELRRRDLGIELMIENPNDFVLSFEGPGDDELCSKLSKLLENNEKQAREAANIFDLTCPPGADLLQHLRSQKGVVCVSVPDPLFRLRHSLTQLHLALHYLDAVDVSIQERPLVHSAMLIRQTLFDPRASDSSDQIGKLRAAVDQGKLNQILEHSERQMMLEKITGHLQKLETLVDSGEFDSICGDYLYHTGLGPCEAFSLHGDLLDLIQQLPGIFRAQGEEEPRILSRLLKRGLDKSSIIAALANQGCAEGEVSPLLAHLKALSNQNDTLTEQHLSGLGLSAISSIAQQLTHEEADFDTIDADNSSVSVRSAGTVAGMLETALGGWSGAVLKVADRLRESDELRAIKLDRVFAAVSEAADIADPKLGGELRVMRRDAVDLTRFSIVGVHGKGLSFGLTDADLQSEALTRRNDYLFADRVDAAGKKVASTSPARLADEVGEALVKAAAHTWVFVLPIDHPEALKFSAWKFDWANKAKAVADGPGVSRVLVGFAAYNLVSEMLEWGSSQPGNTGIANAKLLGAGLDLSAALMKLRVVSSPLDDRLVTNVILRPLFEIRSVPLIGSLIHRRLTHVGAGTIVRSMSLMNFFAGSVMVVVSAWDYRNSISRGDMDAAIGHGLAVVGGSVFVFSKLMNGLLFVPGWGWALFGLGLVLGGSIYAAISTDSEIEQVLKRGPLGIGPRHPGLPDEDVSYHAQLLSMFAPISVSAKRYDDLSDSEKAVFTANNPSPSDYRVTVSSPLISRLKLGQKSHDNTKASADGKKPSLRLGVQELEYTRSTLNTPAGEVEEFSLTRKTTLERITTWIASPDDHSVHFLIERKLSEGETFKFGYREKRTVNLRVVLQARLESEIGAFQFPVPVLDNYEKFDSVSHEALPDKKYQAFNPFSNELVPYWVVKEVAV